MRAGGATIDAGLRRLALGAAAGLLSLLLLAGQAGAAPAADATATATKRYVNTRAGLTGQLRRHYVDFSFRYPAAWSRVPRRQDPLNFVKVVSNRQANGFEAENFAVGWFTGGLRVAPALADQLNADLKRGFPAYKRLSGGRTKLGRYPAYQLRFSSRVDRSGVVTTIWGRVLLVPNPAGGHGATIIMLASSASPHVRRVAEVGVKGQLPVIVRSFRFG